jgi:hypothetical protein
MQQVREVKKREERGRYYFRGREVQKREERGRNQH